MKIVITGAEGLIGWHLRCRLASEVGAVSEVVSLTRENFNEDALLAQALEGASAIVHLAGINRATEEEVEFGNMRLAERLVLFSGRSNYQPHLIYANTTHKQSDTPYGRGKSGADRVFREFCNEQGNLYTEFVLPHVFGEGGRPFYNSAVHTFCHQIVAGESFEVNPEGRVELLHTQEICKAIVDAIQSG